MLYYRKVEEIIDEIKPDRKRVMKYLNSINIYEIENVLVDVEKIINWNWSCQPQVCKNILTTDSYSQSVVEGTTIQTIVTRSLPEKEITDKNNGILSYK